MNILDTMLDTYYLLYFKVKLKLMKLYILGGDKTGVRTDNGYKIQG